MYALCFQIGLLWLVLWNTTVVCECIHKQTQFKDSNKSHNGALTNQLIDFPDGDGNDLDFRDGGRLLRIG